SPKLEKEKFWDTKFGKGRPGWHLECSAMIRKIYNSGIDIHTGGVDLLFPHHENEIAQSEGAFPAEKFVNIWLHCEHLLVENHKMSKSTGNFYTLRDLIQKGYNKKAIRYLLLSYHYRTKLNFSLSRIEESEKAISRIQNTLDRILEENIQIQNGRPDGFAKDAFNEFLEGLGDDLNVPKSLGSIFEFIKQINSAMDNSSISKEDMADCLKYFHSIDSLLGVLEFQKRENHDAEIENLVRERILAKENKNFKKADEIRDLLNRKGIVIEDTKTGVKWKRV
ncbi:MAG: class I tRNA ligase family protein, partial [Leptospiraceae bacterium]|nr:class I tRNA ligase family protein [Leptospiraceae bacterium]